MGMKKFTARAMMAPCVPTSYGGIVSMNAIYDDSEEDRAYAEATPMMNINFLVKNSLIPEMEPGKYRITFEKIEEQTGA